MDHEEDTAQERLYGIPHWVKCAAVSLAIITIGFYIYGAMSHSSTQLGTFGDFVGGTLNPIFALISFLALLYTINIQLQELNFSRQELRLTREELKLSREELGKSAVALESQNETSKRQRFENTLFSMIGVLNQIVVDMDIGKGEGQKSGRDCFTVFFGDLQIAYRKENMIQIERLSRFSPDWEQNKEHNIPRIQSSYEKFYDQKNAELGHYFRVVFNIFRYLDQSEVDQDIYAKLFRAQFSDQELLIIFYNTLSPRGQPLVDYAIKFALFDNLDTTRLLYPEHMKLIDDKAFGANLCTPPRTEDGHFWSDE